MYVGGGGGGGRGGGDVVYGCGCEGGQMRIVIIRVPSV